MSTGLEYQITAYYHLFNWFCVVILGTPLPLKIAKNMYMEYEAEYT